MRGRCCVGRVTAPLAVPTNAVKPAMPAISSISRLENSEPGSIISVIGNESALFGISFCLFAIMFKVSAIEMNSAPCNLSTEFNKMVLNFIDKH